jgi:hypothetical protein
MNKLKENRAETGPQTSAVRPKTSDPNEDASRRAKVTQSVRRSNRCGGRLFERLFRGGDSLGVVGRKAADCFLVPRFFGVVALGEQIDDLLICQGSALEGKTNPL